MDREKLKMVAGYYFKDKLGAEPDTLKFTYEEDGLPEYSIEATLGSREFKIWMCPMHNLIELTEKRHIGTFSTAAGLAGMDKNLKKLL
ncbi:MAG: hypothetical protein LBU80_06010 [Rikenellaceae bacterium]|jgi:hypothetical protein|nr:hypothetical protein [Rikenellaceae bacterium]